MDFSWSDEQLACKASARCFAQTELDRDYEARENQSIFSRENWRKCAQFGILGMPFPKEYGGGACDLLTTVLTMEGLGYGCRDNGLLFALNAQMWSVQHLILAAGTPAQKARYLPGLINGDLLGAHAITEPDAGSDAYGIGTRAEKCPNGYRLNGNKTFITHAPVADLAIVFATTDPQKGMWGLTAFLIEKDTPGFNIGRTIEKMGLRTAPMGELAFVDCLIPDSQRLGAEGGAARLFESAMSCERSGILASHLGAMERQLETCIHRARSRRQFNQPIGQFQSVSNRIADMKVRLETARLLLYQVAWMRQQGQSATLESAMAKLYLSEMFMASSMDAVRTFGGYGYVREYGVEGDLRDAIGGTLYSGTSDIQRNIIATQLGVLR